MTIAVNAIQELVNSGYKATESLYYKGNIDLLQAPKVAIVGSRKPISYTKQYTYKIAHALSQRGVVVVSGTAMGVDTLAHQGAGACNTIAIVAHGIDIRYPKTNAKMIEDIEQQGLVMSAYPTGSKPRKYTFLQRNEIIAALCDMVIICEADTKSGSLNTAKWAIQYKKPIFVLPHRLDESNGTQQLINQKQATMITDINAIIAPFNSSKQPQQDDFILFCHTHPFYEQALLKFGNRLYEEELIGSIVIKEGRVYPT